MLALPPAPAPAPRRQVLAGTAVAGAAAAMLVGGQLAVWWRFREASPLREGADGLVKDWKPESVKIPEVPSNIMLITLVVLCLMAQYALYSAKRRDRGNTILGLGLVALLGLATLNAQAFVYSQKGLAFRIESAPTLSVDPPSRDDHHRTAFGHLIALDFTPPKKSKP